MEPAADIMMLENQLSRDRVLITFTKVDGSVREMLCTRDPRIITEARMPSGHGAAQPETPGILKVYDLEKSGWRSMRKANITSWKLAE